MTRAAAIVVVAGGRSSRFGSDKLKHRVGERTLLERTLDAVRDLGQVVLVTAAEIVDDGLVTVSEYPRWGGPCAAVVAGLDAVSVSSPDAPVLILPADLADPVAAVAALEGIDDGVLVDESGRTQWLLARAPLAVLRARSEELRSAPGGVDGLPVSALLGVISARHEAPGRASADIDTPADLATVFSPDPASLPEEELIHGTV
ncbi:molybdenum cofactor guanylyltransferase [Leifsonia sp. SIMBA_070]|uniref:molybdenum cofactor guanylyltransferase n=1 Tax=Leifsonia sp. SIMBA_070 TaxID=3085810 RepID=UPI00397AE2B7